MKLSHNQKLAVGAATLWIVLYPFVFIAAWLAIFAGLVLSASTRQQPPFAFLGILLCFMPIHFLTIGLDFVLMAFYWAHIIKNTSVSDALRIIFGITIFWFGYFAMPIYFYFFVWREETPQWARPPAPLPASLPKAAIGADNP